MLAEDLTPNAFGTHQSAAAGLEKNRFPLRWRMHLPRCCKRHYLVLRQCRCQHQTVRQRGHGGTARVTRLGGFATSIRHLREPRFGAGAASGHFAELPAAGRRCGGAEGKAPSHSTLWATSLFAQMHPETRALLSPAGRVISPAMLLFFGCYFRRVVTFWRSG